MANLYVPLGFEWFGFSALTPEAKAAWVQAIGAVVALVIAVGTPLVQAFSTAKRRRHKARALALLVMNDVVRVREDMDLLLNSSSLSDVELINAKVEIFLVVPPDLLAARSNLHELGDVSRSIIRMVAIMQMAGAELLNFQIMMRQHPENGDTSGDPDKVRGGIKEVAELAAEAANDIGRLFGEKPIELQKKDAQW